MLKFGEAPYLECSSKGDKRFSAFYARIEEGGLTKSIEDWYQGFKIFVIDGKDVTGLDWRQAKGKEPINSKEAREFYSHLWDVYFHRKPELLEVIKDWNGFTDVFGQEGHACQAEEIYRIALQCRRHGNNQEGRKSPYNQASSTEKEMAKQVDSTGGSA